MNLYLAGRVLCYNLKRVIKMQINRLFEILYVLMNKERVTAKELAERFEVSRQTIIRDIDTLSTAGIPIYTERGRGGGISLLPDFVFDKFMLSEAEQSQILSALHGLSMLKQDDSKQILHKLATIFHHPMPNWLEIDFSEWNDNTDVFDDLKRAILGRQIVQFDYYNSQGDKSFRRIEPMKLWFKAKSWYLKGFCLTKQDIRVYKLLRIKNLVVTDEHFEQHNVNMISENAMDSQRLPIAIQLRLRIAPEMTYRVYDDFNPEEVEKQSDGSFIVNTAFEEDNWVYSFLLSYGQYIEVMKPQHIRAILKQEAQAIAQHYL